jgi:hypothetical protein
LDIEYSITGSGTAEWYECQTGNLLTAAVSGGIDSFCNDGSGVVFYGGASGTPTGNQSICGCNDIPTTTTTTSSSSTTTTTTTIGPS